MAPQLSLDSIGLVTVVLGLALIAFILMFAHRRDSQLKLPPGPAGWPIIGNIYVVFQHPGSSNEDYFFSRFCREFGDVYKLKLGPQLMYILSNVDHVREVFTHSKIQGRLSSVAYLMGIGPGAIGIVFANAPEWSVMRRFIQGVFRDLNVGKGVFAGSIQLELERFVRKLDSLTDEPFDGVYELLYSAIGNITCGITFGHQYDYEDVEFKEVIRIMTALGEDVGPGAIVYTSRILCRLPFGPGKRLMTDIAQFKAHLENRIEMTKSLPESDDQVNSFVKAFLVGTEKGETFFDKNNLITCCLELFFAGTEPTAATLAWAVLYLTTHPAIQAKCQQELDDYVREHGIPRYSDRSKLPYIQAVILETERLASVVPLLLPHRVMEDLHLLGYDFPEGTLVVANVEAINMDEARFPDPFDFKPERFVNNGRFDANGDIMPFSVGRRSCLGEPLARMEIFLFVVNLLHRFTFSPPDEVRMPDYRQGVYGVTRKPLPFAVVIKKR